MSSFLDRHWRKITITAVVTVLVIFLGLGSLIGRHVRVAVAGAQERYPGTPVEALMALAADDRATIHERDRAVWALGQLGDRRALPLLESLASDQECEHGVRICQHEVDKAIALCAGGTNASAIVWRHGELARR